MKKIVLALSAILVLVSCAQTKQWTDKERTEVKEVVRAHKEKTMLKHMEDNNFANIENCVVTSVEGTYPDYNKYDKLTGKTDTLTSVMINCTTEMLGANYEHLPLVFPYPQLQSIGILPADLTPDQISAFYTCFTGKVKEAYPQPATFAQDMCVDPGTTDIIIVMLQQCAQELQGTPAPAAKK